MSNLINPGDESATLSVCSGQPQGRRSFLKWSSVAALAAFAFGGVGADDLKAADAFLGLPIEPPQREGAAVDLGKGDTGILNYAYALEQLEAAFYTQAVSTPYAQMSSGERQILTDIRDHEVVHREFFKTALGKNAIPGLQVNFTAIDFNSRESVLGTAKTFEDLGVSAYNGAGQLLKKPEFLLLAGKIVSVEARHAAAIRDLLQPMSAAFSGDDVVDPRTGLDPARTPAEVLAAAGPFIRTAVTANNLPKPKA